MRTPPCASHQPSPKHTTGPSQSCVAPGDWYLPLSLTQRLGTESSAQTPGSLHSELEQVQGPMLPAVPTFLRWELATHYLFARICPPQPLALDQTQTPPCNLLIGLPWHSLGHTFLPSPLTGHGFDLWHAGHSPTITVSPGVLWRWKLERGTGLSSQHSLSPSTQGQRHRGRWARADGAEGHAGPDLRFPVLS